ncbi:MAG: leucine-rich repeat protein, partial [Eubacteriales bacterium]|nr:leucine-rich repeat protein [Eubacteriales bacterium]
MKKGILAFLLACTITLELIPVSAYADTAENSSDVSVVQQETYEIDWQIADSDEGELQAEEDSVSTAAENADTAEEQAVRKDNYAENQTDSLMEKAEDEAVLRSSEAGFSYESMDGSTVKITEYSGTDKAVRIPDRLGGFPVTVIGSHVFMNHGELEEIQIPDSVTQIGEYAFANCSSLKEIRFPESLKEIGLAAFAGCKSLTKLELPDSIEKIGGQAFSNCENVESTNYPLSWKEAEGGIYEGCPKLKSITIPDSVTEIPANAFRDWKSLEKITIPDGVTVISDSTFHGCSGLKEVKLPQSLNEIGDYAFADCISLKEIRFPESLKEIHWASFYGCKAITKMELPDSVEEIRGEAFANCENLESTTYPLALAHTDREIYRGCTRLKSITIPEGVTEIPSAAFLGCKDIEEIKLPQSLTQIGEYAFANCSSLLSIRFPEDLKEIGWSAFSGCKSLTDLEIPDGVEEIAGYAFASCENVESVKLSEGLTVLNEHVFDSCSALTAIVLPDNLQRLDGECFRNCPNLTRVFIPKSVINLSTRSFNESPNVTIYSEYCSMATIYAIDNQMPFETADTGIDENEALDRYRSNFSADLNAVSTNGIISLDLQYAVRPEFAEDAEEGRVVITLSSSYPIDESTIKKNGSNTEDYEFEENRLSFPAKDLQEIKFAAKSIGDANLYGYAYLEYQDKKEVIGILNEKMDLFSVNAPDVVSANHVRIDGVTAAAQEVTLSGDGVETVTVQASRTGRWRAEVQLQEPADMQMFTILAESTAKDGTPVSQSVQVLYREGEPQLISLDLEYRDHNDSHTVSVNDTDVPPVVIFYPPDGYSFEAKFENAEKITDLYITSTRNSEKKYLKAEYDPEKDSFVTHGYFDEKNESYVPGVISYEYNMQTPQVYVDPNYDFSALAGQLPAEAKDAVDVKVNTETTYESTIDLSKVSEDLNGVALDTYIKIYDEKLFKQNGESGLLGEFQSFYDEDMNFASYVIPGVDDDKYILNLDYSKPKTWAMLVHDVAGSRYIGMVLDEQIASEAFGSDAYKTLSSLSTTLSYTSQAAGYLYKSYAIQEDMNELRHEVMVSDVYSSERERKEALGKVMELEKDEQIFLALTTVMPLIVVGTAMSGPAIVFTAVLGGIVACSAFFWDVRKAQIKGEKYRIKAVVDPSGCVYDAGTKEPLEGVTATAYCIEYDGSDDFWDRKPGEQEYGTLWNALEYDQHNPILTTAEGKYAWDVPEGWWRVKYEKEGYGTEWSSWMTVPPIQTDIDVYMRNENDIGVTGVSLDSSSIELATYDAGTDNRNVSTRQLMALIQPEDAENQTVIWTSSDPATASVDADGLVTAHKYGKAVITATTEDGGFTASCEVQTRFYDGMAGVKNGSNTITKNIADSINWMADQGITTGYDKVNFGSFRTTSRADFVIFLWRYAGKPAADASNPKKFSDIEGKYKKTSATYQAIAWGASRGIINGYSDGTFKPTASVTRGQVAIMLWKFAGKPSLMGTAKNFPDVKVDKTTGVTQNMVDAIKWASSNKLVNGYANGKFEPIGNC